VDARKIENINQLFGYNIYSKNDKPTNGEFIALVADKLIMEQGRKTFLSRVNALRAFTRRPLRRGYSRKCLRLRRGRHLRKVWKADAHVVSFHVFYVIQLVPTRAGGGAPRLGFRVNALRAFTRGRCGGDILANACACGAAGICARCES
jgi:hypothetical protein